LAQYQDSPAAIETAAENEIWGSGYAASMRDFGGEHYLLSPVFNMEEVYTQIVEEVINGEWEAELTYLGMDAGAVDISEPGPNVPSDVVEEVETLRDDMLETDTDEFVWDGTTFEDWTDAEIFFESDEFGIDNIEGESP
jgi:basic membrane protein A